VGLLKCYNHPRKDAPLARLFEALLAVGMLITAYLLLFAAAR